MTTTPKTTTRKPQAAKTAPTADGVTLVMSPDGPFDGFDAADELLAYAAEAHRNFPAQAPAFIDWGLYDAFEAEVRARLNAAHSEVRGGYERAVAAQPSAAEMYARAHIPVPASSLPLAAAAPVPRHAATGVSLPLLRRVRDGLAALPKGEGPAYPAGAVPAEAAASLPPLPVRVPGATQNAPALGESYGAPEWQTLPPLDRTAQPIPWDGAPTTVRIIPPVVAEGSGTSGEGLGELDENAERHLAAFEAAHDEEAPDFPADPEHEDRQDDEAMDEAADPIPVGDWQEIRTEGEAAE